MCFKKSKNVENNKKVNPTQGVDDNVRVNRNVSGVPTNNRFISGSWKGVDNK